MNQILTQLADIFSNPLHAIFLICNICLLEIVLSIDNAAVLATMVKDLPEKMRNKALKYGILGAYLFRGAALLFASLLVNIWWIKPIGGIYLLYLTYQYFKGKSTPEVEDDVDHKESHWLYKFTVGKIGIFWSTVIMVEIMDIVFSIDNIFAVVAFSDNYVLICFGVFIGILAMRFVAQKFVLLMEKYTFLETCAYVVIGILGIKLLLSVLVHFYPTLTWIEGEHFDIIMSGVTILVFVLPILWHNLFGHKPGIQK